MDIPPQLIPPPQYHDMAKAILEQAPGLRNFWIACKNCGLPVEDRQAQHEAQVQFAQAFLDNFYPQP